MRMILISRQRRVAALLAALLAAGGACAGDEGDENGGRVTVVAAFYPLAEAASAVGGDRVAVTNLTPPGAEPHDVELATDDLDDIEDADLLVHLGAGFQPAVEDVADRAGRSLDALGAVEAGGDDPHVWLDPTNLAAIATAIAGALADVDPDGADAYRANAAAYVDALDALDRELRDGLASCARRVVVTAHDAFGHLAARYDLEQVGVAGVSPEDEPDPARLDELADLVEREGVTTIFTESLLPPDIAETLAREVGVEVAVLDPIEGLSDDRLADGATYTTVMRENLAALRAALDCR